MSYAKLHPKAIGKSLSSHKGVNAIRGSIQKLSDKSSQARGLEDISALLEQNQDPDFLLQLRGETRNQAINYTDDSSTDRIWTSLSKQSIPTTEAEAAANEGFWENYKVNPDSYGKIENFKDYYGWDKPGGGGHGFSKPWDRNANGESPWDNFKETQVPSDSKLSEVAGDDANKLWNDVRARLVGSVFADDEHLNKALNESINKLEGFDEAQRNADSLSLTAAYNLSEKGIKDEGIGKIMDAYSEISNYLPDGILTKEYLQKLSSVSEGRDMIGAIQEAKNYDTRDYGGLELSDEQVKATAHKLNKALFDNIANAMDLDSGQLEQALHNNGWEKHKDHMYNLNGATLLAGALDGDLDKEVGGKTGWEKLLEQSEAKYDGEFKVNMTAFLANRAFDTDGENNTDGSAFASTEEGMTGLAALMKHKAGLTDNPFAPNEMALAYNNSDKMKGDVINQLRAMKDANKALEGSGKKLSLDSLKVVVRGHGGENGSTMINSGTHGQDYDGFGKKDSEYFKKILEEAKELGLKELHICYDSCHGKVSSEANAQAAKEAAKELGMNIKIVDHGSTTDGLVDAHQIADSDNGRSEIDKRADGSLMVNRKRDDHAGKTDEHYSMGKEAYEQMLADSGSKSKEAVS